VDELPNIPREPETLDTFQAGLKESSDEFARKLFSILIAIAAVKGWP